MGTLSTTAKTTAVGAVSTAVTHFALFNASDAELSGGSPAYARKAKVDSTPTSNGSNQLAESNIVFDVPAGATVRYVKAMSAASGGNVLGTHQLPADETYGSQGTFTLTSAIISATDPS